MPEARYEVRMLVTEFIGDACGEGVMRCMDKMLMANTPKSLHRGISCGAMKTFTGDSYPRIHYTKGWV